MAIRSASKARRSSGFDATGGACGTGSESSIGADISCVSSSCTMRMRESATIAGIHDAIDAVVCRSTSTVSAYMAEKSQAEP